MVKVVVGVKVVCSANPWLVFPTPAGVFFVRGDLPSDISFFGFPFSVQDAGAKCLIAEQSIAGSVGRFGLDMAGEHVPLEDWLNLAWHHFSRPDDREGGWYLNDREPNLDDEDQTPNGWWRNGTVPTSAQIAHVTMQLPVRIAIDFALLLPE